MGIWTLSPTSFEDGGYLPAEILWREKAAFSDAVGHSMVDYLKAYAETQYTGEAFERGRKSYTHAQPFTKESLLYRDIFEKYYPGQSQMASSRNTTPAKARWWWISGCPTRSGRAAM